jgi:50S ribosomal subunit-associated GTPase HflX
LLVLNKCDRLDPAEAQGLAQSLGGVAVSALTGDGIEAILYCLEPLVFPEASRLGTSFAAGEA